jgi:hypothetical protein
MSGDLRGFQFRRTITRQMACRGKNNPLIIREEKGTRMCTMIRADHVLVSSINVHDPDFVTGIATPV